MYIFPCQQDDLKYHYWIFFCVGVMYTEAEYDVCDVTLSVYPHRASLKNMPGHGGNRTYATFGILAQYYSKV
jgi:hypothetical protein